MTEIRSLKQGGVLLAGHVLLASSYAGFLFAFWPTTAVLYLGAIAAYGLHVFWRDVGIPVKCLWIVAFILAGPLSMVLYALWGAYERGLQGFLRLAAGTLVLVALLALADRVFPADRGFQQLKEDTLAALTPSDAPQEEKKRQVMSVLEEHPFRPSWWLRGQHFQTIWNVFRDKSPLPFERERLDTPDGDFLYTHTIAGDAQAPQVLLLHGLEGSVQSAYMLGFHRAFRDIGWTATTMEFRSCSGEMNKTKRIYHMGETTDIDFVVRTLAKRNPERPIYLVGFSLGANVVAKWLGEQGDSVPSQVRGAAVVSPPFNPVISAPDFHKVLGGLYLNNFLETLIPKAIEKDKQFPGVLDVEAIKNCKDFYAFDTLVTAKLHGFRDAGDYYEKVGCHQFLPGIRRATLLLTAADDPFNPAVTIPWDKANASPWLHPQFSAHGGHVGFVTGAAPWRTRFWSEDQVVRFFLLYDALDRAAALPHQSE